MWLSRGVIKTNWLDYKDFKFRWFQNIMLLESFGEFDFGVGPNREGLQRGVRGRGVGVSEVCHV